MTMTPHPNDFKLNCSRNRKRKPIKDQQASSEQTPGLDGCEITGRMDLGARRICQEVAQDSSFWCSFTCLCPTPADTLLLLSTLLSASSLDPFISTSRVSSPPSPLSTLPRSPPHPPRFPSLCFALSPDRDSAITAARRRRGSGEGFLLPLA